MKVELSVTYFIFIKWHMVARLVILMDAGNAFLIGDICVIILFAAKLQRSKIHTCSHVWIKERIKAEVSNLDSLKLLRLLGRAIIF